MAKNKSIAGIFSEECDKQFLAEHTDFIFQHPGQVKLVHQGTFVSVEICLYFRFTDILEAIRKECA